MIEQIANHVGGTFPDVYVDAHDAVWRLWHDAGQRRIVITRNGTLYQTIPTDGQAQFARFCSPDWIRIAVIYRDAQDVGQVVPINFDPGGVRPLTVLTGNRPFIADQDGIAWQDRASMTVLGCAWGAPPRTQRTLVKPTGLSRFVEHLPRFVDEEVPDGNARVPRWSLNGAVLVEQHATGGVKATVGDVSIVLRDGENTFAPCVAGPTTAGAYVITAWGDQGIVWTWTVTVADFVTTQPDPDTQEDPDMVIPKGTILDLELQGIKTADGQHFICAEDGGGRDVNATRTAAGAWETFRTKAKLLEDVPVNPK